MRSVGALPPMLVKNQGLLCMVKSCLELLVAGLDAKSVDEN